MMYNDTIVLDGKQYRHDFDSRLLISESRPSENKEKDTKHASKELKMFSPFFCFFQNRARGRPLELSIGFVSCFFMFAVSRRNHTKIISPCPVIILGLRTPGPGECRCLRNFLHIDAQ